MKMASNDHPKPGEMGLQVQRQLVAQPETWPKLSELSLEEAELGAETPGASLGERGGDQPSAHVTQHIATRIEKSTNWKYVVNMV